MTNADNCCCSNFENADLAAIVQQDSNISIRWGQIAQAFGGTANSSVPVSNANCSSERTDLLAAILAQRQAIFDQIQQAILAA